MIKSCIGIVLITITSLAGEWNYDGSLNVTLSNDDANLVKNGQVNKSVRGDMRNGVSYVDDEILFVGELGLVRTNVAYNAVMRDYIKELTMVYINNLYVTKLIADNISMTLGTISFNNGDISNCVTGKESKSNGVHPVINHIVNGGFLTYVQDNLTVSVGYGGLELGYKVVANIEGQCREITDSALSDRGSTSYFVLMKYHNKKQAFEFNYYKPYIVLEDKDVGTAEIAALTYNYDDNLNSGNVFYGLLSGSKLVGDSSVLMGFPYVTDKIHLDKIDATGWMSIVGYKKYMDIHDRDIYIGIEHQYIKDGYFTLNKGAPYSLRSYADYGNTYITYIGAEWSKNLEVYLRYSRYVNDSGYLKDGGLVIADGDADHTVKYIDNTVLNIKYSW